MAIMEHPNGCVHEVREDLVEKFSKAGWTIKKGEATASPVSPDGQKKRKTTTKAKK